MPNYKHFSVNNETKLAKTYKITKGGGRGLVEGGRGLVKEGRELTKAGVFAGCSLMSSQQSCRKGPASGEI